jgi:uncharacterized protein involved in response to NO
MMATLARIGLAPASTASVLVPPIPILVLRRAAMSASNSAGPDPARAARLAARRGYTGPVLLEQGFRPFFTAAGAWAALALGLWIAFLTGHAGVPTAFDAMTWHAHGLLFGFVGAAIAGFLLTAVPNWTGRLPVRGAPLAALALLWLAGRIAVSTSAWIGPAAAAVIDLAFWLVLGAAMAREILAGNNRRNLPVVVAVALFGAADALVHAGALGWPAAGPIGIRLGIAVAIFLITLIGGRIVPSFTRNWLAKRGNDRLPVSRTSLDVATMIGTGIVLAAWSAIPTHSLVGAGLLAVSLLHALRLAKWRGSATLAEPLVTILHVGYAWVPVGLTLAGLAAISPAIVSPVAGLHALTAGAMGTMILAVMTRASLGHSGRELTTSGSTLAIYALVTIAALARVAAAFMPSLWLTLLIISAVAWIGAFSLFTVIYGRIALKK